MSYTNAVNIEIDGQKLQAEAGSMIIEAGDHLGVRIPRFCYHKKLSIAANCRMCLVEVANAPKPLPACATPVSEGMVIKTASPKALEAQKSVMEFLLINHPLDCPVCDQGGECELQDIAMGYGPDVSRFTEEKRVVVDTDLGPLIATEMTRCIHCTRCVRFGEEVAGIREMGATGRGEHTRIGTFIEKAVRSEVSANIIDLCPVGALTSKPFRFKARAWELKQYPGVALHDCLGSNVYWHVWNQKIVRTVPREKESINEVWLSDRDRFSYQGLNSVDRLLEPRVFSEGAWQVSCWEGALAEAAERINQVIQVGDAQKIAMVLSPNCTLEEGFLAKKIAKAVGFDHIEHRIYQQDFRNDGHFSVEMGIQIDQLTECSVVLCIGADVQREQPLLSIRLFQATQQNDTEILLIHPVALETAFPVSVQKMAEQGDLLAALLGLAKALGIELSPEWGDVMSTPADQQLAKSLQKPGRKALLLGQLAVSHPDFSLIQEVSKAIAERCEANIGVLSPGANSVGLSQVGVMPSAENPVSFDRWEQESLKVVILVNVEPENDAVNGASLLKTLQQADHVIAITPYLSPDLLQYADVILPMAPFSETSGTVVNANGVCQTFHPTLEPMGQARPLWKILRVLGNVLQLDGFDYQTRETILDDFKHQGAHRTLPKKQTLLKQFVKPAKEGFIAVLPQALYGTDAVVRRAPALQAVQGKAEARLNAKAIQVLGLCPQKQLSVQWQNAHIQLPWVEDSRVPDGVVVIPAGLKDTRALGAPYAKVTLKAIEGGV